MTRQRWAVHCTAQRTQGRGPCQAYAIVGGTVCRAHGGAAPQVRAAARQRLAYGRVEAVLSRMELREREGAELRVELIARVLDCSMDEARRPYIVLLARSVLEVHPEAGGLTGRERALLAPLP